jgi:cytochrome c-type biogenesis protein CcmH
MRRSGALVGIYAAKAPALAVFAAMALALPFAAPAALAVPAATAAAPQTSLPDVEDEVMCPICGTLLQLAESPQAQRERAFVRRQIAAGKSKAEIKDALVAQYGSAVLALPGGSGFDLTAYLVPAIAFAVAALALALGVRRWRRAGRAPGPPPNAPAGPQGEDAERLDADLARYDL